MVDDSQQFGSCCGALKEALEAAAFDPLITVGENDVLYLTLGLLEMDDNEPGLVDHPMFFCPFCGEQVQTPEGVEAKTDDDEVEFITGNGREKSN